MNISKKWTPVLLITVFALSVSWAYGQTTPAEEPAKTEKWEFVAVPYFWMSSISGDVTVHGIPTHMTIPFNEVFKALDFGGQVHAEAWKGKWGGFVDATYIDLSTGAQGVLPRRGPASGDVGLQEWLVEFGGLYRFGRWPLGKSEKTALTLEGLVGGRYWNLLELLT